MRSVFTVAMAFLLTGGLYAQPTQAPTLSLPNNNVVNEKSMPFMLWSILSGVTHYQIQMDTISTFNSAFSKTDTAVQNKKYMPDLRFGYKYYWRVRGVNAGGNGPWSSVRNFTVFARPDITIPYSNPSLNNNFLISSNFLHSSNGAHMEYDVDTSLSFSSPWHLNLRTVKKDTFRVSYRNLYFNTKYYVRARAYHSNDTTAWVDTFIVNTQASPKLSAPVNASIIGSFYVTYAWTSSTLYSPDTSLRYQLEVDTSALFNSAAYFSTIKDSLTLKDSTNGRYRFGVKYYSRVRAMHRLDTSDWSQVYFNIYTMPNIINPVSFPPQKPERLKITPDDHPGVDYFIYDLDTTVGLSSPYAKTDTITNWKAKPDKLGPYLKFGKTYTLGLRAVRGTDTSAMRKVTFSVASAINLLFPGVSSSQPAAVDLQWSNVLGSISYQLELDTLAAFNSGLKRVINVSGFNGTYPVNDLWYGKKVHWRVRGMHPEDTSAWTPYRMFSTTAAPLLEWPHDGDTNYIKNDDISCYPIEGSRFYEFQVSEDSLFGTAFSDTTLVDPDWDMVYMPLTRFNIKYKTKYFWRARAINLYDTSDWSATWRLTTREELPLPPKVSLNSPSNGSFGHPYTIKLIWNALSNVSYELHLSRSNNFSTLDHIGYIFGTPEMTVDSLLPNTTYYWRVRASNAEKEGAWSDTWDFSTLPVIFPPINLYPDGYNNIPLNVTLNWEDIFGATGYGVRWGTTANLIGKPITTVSQSELPLTNLLPNTRYYWEVFSLNTYYYTNWSFTAQFVTTKNTGTGKSEAGAMVRLYPNPASDQLNIDLPALKTGSVKLTDLAGRELMQVQLAASNSTQQSRLDISSLTPGIYLVQVTIDEISYIFKTTKN